MPYRRFIVYVASALYSVSWLDENFYGFTGVGPLIFEYLHPPKLSGRKFISNMISCTADFRVGVYLKAKRYLELLLMKLSWLTKSLCLLL